MEEAKYSNRALNHFNHKGIRDLLTVIVLGVLETIWHHYGKELQRSWLYFISVRHNSSLGYLTHGTA